MNSELLVSLARRYETPQFLTGDPSWFMHQVEGQANREAMALMASCLSYGSRRQFMPKIEWLLRRSGGNPDRWVRQGLFETDLPAGSADCYYRLYTCGQMNQFLRAYRQMLAEHGTMGQYVGQMATDGLSAVGAICRFFSEHGVSVIIPKDTQSACKRVCMLLRWMVRSGSPVDLGLWAHIIDRRTLIMPLDTHVLQQSERLGLLTCKTASMAAARRLTAAVARVFPDDPLRADFALFGYGVNEGRDLQA